MKNKFFTSICIILIASTLTALHYYMGMQQGLKANIDFSLSTIIDISTTTTTAAASINSTEPQSQKKQPTSTTTTTTKITTTTYAFEISPHDFKHKGRIFYDGWWFTWYSEKVLPGHGLNIPGRHSDANFVRDGDGYICCASVDKSKGTVIHTPWGAAKVYDTGCPSGVIDIYTTW